MSSTLQDAVTVEKATPTPPALAPRRTTVPQPWIAVTLTILFVAVGAVLRLHAYLRRPSLWLDELSLALNLADRDFHGLTRPLALSQAAPVGWLWLEKLSYDLLGSSEYALRLPSLVAALLLLVVTAVLARQLLPTPYSWVPVAIVALCPRLIEYSSELKPYSVDALLVPALVAYVVFAARRRQPWTLLLWGALAALCATMSLPALLAAAGGSLVLVVACLRDAFRLRTARGNVMLVGAVAAQVPWALVARWERQHLDPTTVGGSDFWAPGYPHTLLGLPTWLPRATDRLGAYFQLRPAALLLPVVLVGLVALVRTAVLRRELPRIVPLLLLLVVALGAAGLQLYPLMQRATLYLVAPVAVLAAAIPTLTDGPSRRRQLLGQAIATATVAVVAVSWIDASPTSGGGGLKVPAEPPLAYVKAHLQPGDAVLVHYWTRSAYRWYGDQLALPPGLVMLPSGARSCSARTAAARLAPAQRMWAVEVDRPLGKMSQEAFFGAAGQLGTALETHPFSSGARVVLYQLTPPDAVPAVGRAGLCPAITSPTEALVPPRAPAWG